MQQIDNLENRDIIIVGQQPWDVEIGSNCKNLAVEFSKKNRVLYVNSALDRITLYKERNTPKVQKRLQVIAHKQPGIVKISDNLWNLFPDCLVESITWLKSRAIFNFLNKINNRKFSDSIQKAADELGMKNFILFNDNDMFRSYYLKDFLKPAVSIYYSRDYMLGVDYWKFHGSILEPKLIAKSDICAANSTYLANYCKKYNPSSYYVGQGCDLKMFSGYSGQSLPADMTGTPKPVIGYVGALQSIRLDIALLGFLARQKPEWSIVLVGPEDDTFKSSDLHGIKNIFFLGSKQPADLPAYIDSFDVCINPQIVNEVTIGNYPRKIDEYLAMGKPVVATRTDAMSIFEEYTYLADDQGGYVEMITKALVENNAERQQSRKIFAASHTWENNVKEIYKAINAFERAKNG